MFSDLRGFTTISEGMNATELTRFLNEYLTPMTDIVLQQRGTVDKYIGDAIMAFWNAPLDDDRHAVHAVEAALGMRATLAALNARWSEMAKAAGRPFRPVRFGVGLNTGLACVGNLGSLRRFDYSVIGDEVNVASRLESATKMFDVDIVASEATRAEAPAYAWLEVDSVVFKNKTRPVGVYALVGDEATSGSSEFIGLAKAHERMMELYRQGDFADARAMARDLEPRAPAPDSRAIPLPRPPFRGPRRPGAAQGLGGGAGVGGEVRRPSFVQLSSKSSAGGANTPFLCKRDGLPARS